MIDAIAILHSSIYRDYGISILQADQSKDATSLALLAKLQID